MSAAERFHPLPVSSLAAAPSLPRLVQTAHLDDAAQNLFTDLRHSPCVVASHHDGLDQTLYVMQRAGVRMAFVSGLHGELLGLVTSDDLHGERPLLRALADHVRHEDLTLEQVMTPVARWQVVDIAQLGGARVGHIVATLREHNLRYLLVVERVDAETALRGLFSARRIELALQTTIEGDMHSGTFADLEATLVRRGTTR